MSEKQLILLHVVPWDQCRGWTPEWRKSLYALCGLQVQEPPSRLYSWVNPDKWTGPLNASYYRCTGCMSHKDYPLLVLGDL